MFSISQQILSVPVFSGLDGGVVSWPTVGAVLAWMLVAAFVGSLLGLLWHAQRPQRRRAENTARLTPNVMRQIPAAPSTRAAPWGVEFQ